MITPISANDTLALRHAVLGPNQPIDTFRMANDAAGRHYGAYRDDKLVAVLSLFINARKAQVCQFATLPTYQNQGIGSALLQHVISEATYLGAKLLYCEAPSNSASFYARYGLTPTGAVSAGAAVPYQQFQRSL